jgi:hypothetical protein
MLLATFSLIQRITIIVSQHALSPTGNMVIASVLAKIENAAPKYEMAFRYLETLDHEIATVYRQ